MKKKLLAFAMCLGYVVGFAQLMDVGSIKEVKIPENVQAGYSTISPNGDYLLVTDFGRNGLTKVDLNTGATTLVTNAQGAGYDVKILDDGNTIVYRETNYKGHLKKSSLKSTNLQSGEKATIVSSTRDLQGVAVKNGGVFAIKNGKIQTKQLSKSGKISASTPVLSINNGQLMLTIGSKTRVFSPNGTNVRYIWPSISPDGTKALYCVSGLGAFVCNLDGSNVTSLGVLRAPKWYNNQTVVGMEDFDGEYDTVKSSIIAADINGKTRQTLTDSSVIAMYPTVSSKGDKILFSTPAGDVYVININVKK